MASASSTIIPGGETSPVRLNYPSGQVQGCVFQNPTGYNAYLGDSSGNVLVKIPSGQGASFPVMDQGLYAWTDASPGSGFSAGGQCRVTLTTLELQFSSGEINEDFVVPGAVVSFNSRTGAVTLTSLDVTGALGFTPRNNASATVDTFNTRSGAVTLTSLDVTGALTFTPMRAAPGAPAAQVVGASPWTYQNAGSNEEVLFVQGGTVSLLEYSHDGAAWIDTGQVAGMLWVSPGHRLRVTYTVVPTVNRQVK